MMHTWLPATGGRGPGGLAALLDSGSLAIVGASPRAGSAGSRVLHHLRGYGYRGRVVAVNPNHDEIDGVACAPSLRSFAGERLDQALLLVGAAMVPEAVADAAYAGVGAVSVFSAGYAEVGADGAARQREIAARARAGGMRMLGPNCLGVLNARLGLAASSTAALETVHPEPGPVGIVTQSGGVGTYLLGRLADVGLGVSYFVSTGNEADVELAECVDFVARDAATRVVVAYVEGLRDGPAFVAALEAARARGTAVVVLKGGRTALGSEALRSHTAALAGEDAVYEAVLTELGAIRVGSIVEAALAARTIVDAAALRPPARARPELRSVAVVTLSGGIGVLVAEELLDAGFALPPVPEPAQRRMRQILPYCATANPVDATAQIVSEPATFEAFVRLTLEDDTFDAAVVVLAHTGLLEAMHAPVRDSLAAVAGQLGKPICVIGDLRPALERELREHGILTAVDAPDAARALAVLRERRAARPAAAAASRVAARPVAPTGAARALDEHDSARLLAAAGVPCPPQRLVADAAGALAFAGEIGYPVVLKALDPGVLHKSEHGAVRLGLAGPDALAAAHAELAAAGVPGRRLLVAAMEAGAVAELIVGVRHDDVFGRCFLVGAGGLFAELAADRAVVLSPPTRPRVLDALRRLRVHPLLAGARGRPGADLDAVAGVLLALERLCEQDPDVAEVEINPLAVRAAGHGAVALDALVLRRDGAPA